MKKRLPAAAATLAAFAALAAPAEADPAHSLTATNSILTGTTLSLKNPAPEILDRVVITGRIPIPGPGQTVTMIVRLEGAEEFRRELATDPASGRFKMPLKITDCCDYVLQALHGSDTSDPLAFEARGPARLEPGPKTLLFNKLLRDRGYHMGTISDQYDESTELAIPALRKANGLPISDSYAPKLFSMLLQGNGGRFEPVHTEDGRHVEVDLSRQVMALVEDGKATDVFQVSTGAFGTPTGDYSFYSKGPGYNAKGMYYSIYYSGNYATHGYSSVPYYPASHGCVRNPIPYSVFIYDWIDLGDKMYVYE